MFTHIYNKLMFLKAQGIPVLNAVTSKDITDSFIRPHQPTSDDTIMQWVIIAGAVILLFGTITLIRNIFFRRQVFIPAGWITSPRLVRNILNSAITQRSTFEVKFTDKDHNHPIIRCTPNSLVRNSLSLEAYGISSIAHNWIDREVACYFRVNIKEQAVYYTFTTQIVEADNKPRGMTYLWLKAPERLQNRQKRSFLRLNPPSELLLGSAIWHGLNLPPDSKLDDVSAWVKPNLALLPNRKPQFYIKDLSAGGLRLRIPTSEFSRDNASTFSVSEQIVVLLDLHDPDSAKKIRFWLKCRIQNVLTDYDKKNIELGVQILAWAAPREDGNSLEWLKLTRENEVAPLGNWIVRRHMEQFRTSPE